MFSIIIDRNRYIHVYATINPPRPGADELPSEAYGMETKGRRSTRIRSQVLQGLCRGSKGAVPIAALASRADVCINMCLSYVYVYIYIYIYIYV